MYIFASTRSWNKIAFNFLKNNIEENGLYVENMTELISALNVNESPRWVFFAHWSEIIPEYITRKINGVIFHCTDLPYGRGGSPLQNLIIRGHKETKVSAIRLVNKLDAGNILLKSNISLDGSASEIFERMAHIIGEQCLRILRNDYNETEQEGEVTFFKRRKPDESNLDKNSFTDLESIYNFIRMLDCDGYPRAYVDIGIFRFEFAKATYQDKDSVSCQVKISKKKGD